MPRRLLTDRFCAYSKPQDGQPQTEWFDENVPGLALRVSAGGARSWAYHFTWGGKRARMTLGTYPATSLGKARAQAELARSDLEAGTDPRSTLAKIDTVRAVCEEFYEREGHRVRTGAYRRGVLIRLVYPTIGDRPITEVRRSDLIRLLDAIEDENGPVMADHVLGYLRRVMNWYASRSDEFASPIVRGMARTKPKERARERVLSDDELRLVWRVSERPGIFGCFVRFVLMTSARLSEAANMEWTELDGVDWTLPAARNKTKVDLVRPLSQAAVGVLPEKGDGPYVFSTNGRTPISGFSKFKAVFDLAVMAEAGGPLPRWTIHDLRRTARSLMSRAGVPADHAERCLGHVIGGIRGTYDRHDFYDEKARAFEALAGLVDRIINPTPNVVQMKVGADG
jgi:integrase